MTGYSGGGGSGNSRGGDGSSNGAKGEYGTGGEDRGGAGSGVKINEIPTTNFELRYACFQHVWSCNLKGLNK